MRDKRRKGRQHVSEELLTTLVESEWQPGKHTTALLAIHTKAVIIVCKEKKSVTNWTNTDALKRNQTKKI